MDVTTLLKNAQKFTDDNLPTILSAVAVVGTVTTTYLTTKTTFKAAKKIDDANFVRKQKGEPELSTPDKVALVWKSYILPMGSASFTITCIVGANRISTKRAAAVAAAYALSNDRMAEYKDKVLEKLGDKKEQALRDEVSQKRVNDNPPEGQILVLGDGEVLCLDHLTGRYFHSTREKIDRAENEVNAEILRSGWANLSDFYERVGLKATPFSEEFGWHRPKQMEVLWSTAITPDGKPCLAFDIDIRPIRNGNDPEGNAQSGLCAVT